MLNFLPQKNKNQIICEYLLRLLLAFLVFILASSLILTSLFLPSFFYVKYKNDTINMQLDSVKKKNISLGEDPISFIKNVNRLSLVLSNNLNASDVEIINKIISIKNNDIKILSIDINKDDNTNTKKIMINGIAGTRDSLTTFDKDIKIDGFFDSVTFPVSNFIKNSNSEFSATLIYKNK